MPSKNSRASMFTLPVLAAVLAIAAWKLFAVRV